MTERHWIGWLKAMECWRSTDRRSSLRRLSQACSKAQMILHLLLKWSMSCMLASWQFDALDAYVRLPMLIFIQVLLSDFYPNAYFYLHFKFWYSYPIATRTGFNAADNGPFKVATPETHWRAFVILRARLSYKDGLVSRLEVWIPYPRGLRRCSVVSAPLAVINCVVQKISTRLRE